MESTVNMMARPGMTESHHDVTMKSRPSATMTPQAGVRRWDARTEETERRFQQDDITHLERRKDDDGVEHVGEDVAEDDAKVRRPGDASPCDEVHLLQR